MYIKDADGNIYIEKLSGVKVIDVEPAVYEVDITENEEMVEHHLRRVSDTITLPAKIYGATETRADRVLGIHFKTDATETTGLLLTGNKGAGKTLLSDVLTNKAIAKGMAVINVSRSFINHDILLKFLTQFNNCVFVFDEFGKNFHKQLQEKMLTLFDGLHSSNRLIILIENEISAISDFFLDRPSRILFHYHYNTLDPSIVKQYCKDNLKYKRYQNDIVTAHKNTPMFTFDKLKGLVSACNRLTNGKMAFSELIRNLNIHVGEQNSMEIIKVESPNIPVINPMIKEVGPGNTELRYTVKDEEGSPIVITSYINNNTLETYENNQFIHLVKANVPGKRTDKGFTPPQQFSFKIHLKLIEGAPKLSNGRRGPVLY